MVWAGIVPTACGARPGRSTVTVTICEADRPPGSRAVTVKVELPAATAPMVIVLPDTETAATAGFDDVAAYSSASPSGSLKYDAAFTVAVSPAAMVRAGIVPTACGARLGRCTVTVMLCEADRPPGSRAVTVTVALPAAATWLPELGPLLLGLIQLAWVGRCTRVRLSNCAWRRSTARWPR